MTDNISLDDILFPDLLEIVGSHISKRSQI